MYAHNAWGFPPSIVSPAMLPRHLPPKSNSILHSIDFKTIFPFSVRFLSRLADPARLVCHSATPCFHIPRDTVRILPFYLQQKFGCIQLSGSTWTVVGPLLLASIHQPAPPSPSSAGSIEWFPHPYQPTNQPTNRGASGGGIRRTLEMHGGLSEGTHGVLAYRRNGTVVTGIVCGASQGNKGDRNLTPTTHGATCQETETR